jgi:NAD(P)-dependent dehydrogenase (short-subunit alcohol dehydrogenase family)
MKGVTIMSSLETYCKLFSLGGKVALVAGGAGGIGASICQALAAFGATTVICDQAVDKAEKLVADIKASGASAWATKLDAVDVDSISHVVDSISKEHGSIDVLVNCVGTQIEAPAEEYKPEDWDRIFSINLKSAFFLSQAVAKVQIPAGGGKHIHISSVRSALGIHRGYIGYCASKGGMNMMIKQLATEWAKHKITVNGIAPTFVRTELVKKYLDDPDFYNPLVARIPLGRVGEPVDVAGLAVYLAVPASDFITGQIIFADGGVTACQ